MKMRHLNVMGFHVILVRKNTNEVFFHYILTTTLNVVVEVWLLGFLRNCWHHWNKYFSFGFFFFLRRKYVI
jgi:hypothetical protein